MARIITDIDAGAPESFGEVMIMIVNYMTDAVYGFVAYVIAIFIFNLLFEKLSKKTALDNTQSKNNNKNNNKNKNKADEEHSSALFED